MSSNMAFTRAPESCTPEPATVSMAELQDAINRYNFEQNLPQMKLSQFANLFSSVPQGGVVTQTATPQGGK